MRSERCRVVVKARPTFPSEEDAVGDGILLPGPGRIVLGKDFEADHVYLPSDGDSVYQDEVQTLVASLYEGINSTVFAYGASGSGKTHTVLGCKDTPGLVDRITDEVFARYDQRTCTVSVSVEELYCERFTDLLAASAHPPAAQPPSSSSTSSSSGGSNLGPRGAQFRPSLHHHHSQHHRQAASANSKYNWQKVTLHSSSEMKALVQHVLRKRHTASTCLNDKSSRSHVIVTLEVEQRKAISEHKQYPAAEDADSSSVASGGGSVSRGGSVADLSSLSSSRQQLDAASETRSVQEDAASEADSQAADVSTYLIGKLYLVDLAGSENIKRSGAEGTQQKEAGEINKSLCHLKTVIEEVYRGRRVTTYRNSKLTFRLQDALGGGKNKLLVVACISTAKSDLRETKETLLFAEMARRITNTPLVNREPKDELIHRLQLQVAELQDQLRAAKAESGGGRAAVDEVLRQLNAVEAAFADLQEEMESKEAKWTSAARKVQQQVASLQQLLQDAQAREAGVKQQLAAEAATVTQLQQRLSDEQTALQGSQEAGTAAVALLQGMQRDASALQQLCDVLQQQAAEQQAAAAAAVSMCAEQQQQAQAMQLELAQLRQQLQQEHAARAAADAQVCALQQQQAAVRLAAQQCAAEADQGMQSLSLVVSSLQQQASAAHTQQQAALRQHSAVAASLEASQAAQAAVQQQLAAAESEVRQQHQQLSELQQQLAAAESDAKQQHKQLSQLQQTLEQREAQHAAALSAEAGAHAKAAAQAAAEHREQQQALQRQLQAAQGCVAQLQAQLEDERSEHEALLSAERLRHEKQLAESMHSSVKKLTADKLRCREHLSQQMHSIRAEAQSLSKVLASPSPMVAARAAAAAAAAAAGGDVVGSDTDDAAGAAGDSGPPSPDSETLNALDLQDPLPPSSSVSSRRRVSPVPTLQLEGSDAVLSDTTAAPMQDVSEQCLSGGDSSSSGSEACSSGETSSACSPSGAPMGPAAQQAAIMAVATVAFSRAATSKGLTPRPATSVSVHVEAGGDCSAGGAAAAAGTPNRQRDLLLLTSRSSRAYAAEGVEARGSPSDRMMLPPFGSASASPSLSSIDGSQGGGTLHPAVAAASAAAAAAAARARSSGSSSASKEQQSRHRRRRRELTRNFSSGSWPISYATKGEVDMAAAAAAFSQLRGGQLNVENLQRFLEHRMLGGKLHTKTLSVGGKKRKHELIQDMLAYHRWHLANCGSGGNNRNSSSSVDKSIAGSDTASTAGGAAASTAGGAATLTPRSSSACSSTESGAVLMWNPLGRMSRPGSAGPSSAAGSPAKPEFVRYSHDTSSARGGVAGGAGGAAAGIGRYSLAESQQQAASRAAGGSARDARGAAGAGAGGLLGSLEGQQQQQPQSDVAAGSEHKQQQQLQQQQQSGRWSWLTPRRRKQHSILAQLQASDTALLKQQQSAEPAAARPGSSGSSFGAQLVAAATARSGASSPKLSGKLSLQLPRYSSEGGGCDAVSPRDNRPFSGRAPGSAPSSRPTTPSSAFGGLSGRTIISGVTGSAVAQELCVASPAVKVVPGGSRQRGGGGGDGSDPARLAVDLGSAHRSSWRQVQLLKPK